MKSVGALIADVCWEFRWQTWAVRYLSITTWVLRKGGPLCLIALNEFLRALARHNLRLIDKLNEGH